MITETIGERLRNIRKEKGLTQESLAEISGLHNTYIGQVERGIKNLTLESLEKIVMALDISFDDVFRHVLPSNQTKDTSALNTLINRLELLTVDEQKDILQMIELMMKWKQK